jgi:predicted nucleic acid-binding protein
VRQVLEAADSIAVPFVTIAELRAGFALGTRGSENERILTSFLQQDGVLVLFPDDRTTHEYAAVYADLRRRGRPIPTNDMWIAALALQHGLTLYARDIHFDSLPQLLRV